MRSGKLIDISRSSLISLKAELTRKQEEIQKVKEHESYTKLPPKPKKEIKTNPGVEQRNERDIELTEEEVDLLKKSREVLEVKASLYEKFQKGEVVSQDGKSHYLVDFSRKSPERTSSVTSDVEKPSTSTTFRKPSNLTALEKPSVSTAFDNLSTSQQEEVNYNVEETNNSADDQNEDFELDGDEWVEYEDCLGRTRTCHRSDLSMMKERDKSLAAQLNVEKEDLKETKTSDLEDSNVAVERELLSKDMHLEELRIKWEEKEKNLANKQDIHYEDVLFDEARSHGVGYWAFSTDAEKRAEEQEMFKRVRAETEKRQQEAAALRKRRDDQRQARLIAARERQRARLGLPPISADDIKEREQSDVAGPSSLNIAKEQLKEENVDDLERKLMRAAHVRPWDVGKDGVSAPVMTQEEWVEKKRAERIEEFAPIPSSSPPKTNIKPYKTVLPKKKLIPKQKESDINLQTSESVNVESKVSGYAKNFVLRNESIYGENRGMGVEIPPPSELQAQTSSKKRKIVSVEETAAAIEAGLKYLREEHEKSQKAPTRGTYNMI